MQRKAALAALAFAVGSTACGPSPKPKPATASIDSDGAEPQSTEWLYATPNSSGELAQDCKLVVDVLRKEQSCSGDLCQHAQNLAKDWLAICAKLEGGHVSEVEQLAASFDARRKVSGGECAFQGEELITKGCPPEGDCTSVAQHWATSCSEHASPLVVRMIEKHVSRSAQKPVHLDTTPCAKLLADLTESTNCGNDFECETKVKGLGEYQTRCVDVNQPQSLDDAVKQATLLVSAKQQPPAIWVQDTKFPPEKGRLLFDDGSGFVVAVGDRPVPNVNLFIKALRDSDVVLQVKLARLFPGANNRTYLHVAAIDVADPESYFRRFPSLALTGQREALNGDAANTAIAKLNEVVKQTNEAEAALSGLVSTLALIEPLESDADFKAELAKADKHLVRIFERLAAAKRAKLPKTTVRGDAMRERVAFARRSWQQPLFDVTLSGQVELGATSPGVLLDLAALLPASFEAYRKSIDGSIGKALRKLEVPAEAKLRAAAMSLAERCAASHQELLAIEHGLLSCAFGLQTCTPDPRNVAETQMDETVAAYQQYRAELAAAVASLAEAPQGPLGELAASELGAAGAWLTHADE